MSDLKEKAIQIRKDIVTLVYNGKCGHIGGDLSVTDILVALYYKHLNCTPENFSHPDRDRFILSKGHSVESLYCVLADRGFFPREELDTFSQFGSNYIGHPNRKVRGIEMNSGSLGHGLPVAVGMALAGKMDHASYRVYTVMGDGELAEGSVWEGVMAGSHYKLDNLTAIVDRNRLQISGGTEEVMSHDSQEERWAAFGWHVISIPGNDLDAIDRALCEAKETKGRPTVIIANTTKGCGISFMENKPEWHHKVPTEEQYQAALKELDERSVASHE
ncbi:transketolase [Anaerolentibacter hominis]|uniref:transketolase n=1 Tax=Anaerolentibacter hominis TaxID=3079009 RepID=UPI0031B85F15